MIEELRATRPKANDRSSKLCTLKKNTPVIIDKNFNSYKLLLYENKAEEGVDEKLYIESTFNDDSFALVTEEYKINVLKNSKAPDFSYYYFKSNNNMIVYLYDLKKTLVGLDTIIHLVDQWTMGIATAKSCEVILNANHNNYALEDIHIGVVTENDDAEKRKRDLDILKKQSEMLKDKAIPEFVINMHKADLASDIQKIKILQRFEDGYMEFEGKNIKFDVRVFVNNEYTLKFTDGVLGE